MLKISTSVGIVMKKPNAAVPKGGSGISLGAEYISVAIAFAPNPPRMPIIAETQ
jgi:hypothetical protein